MDSTNANCCRLLRDAIEHNRFPLTYDERYQEVQLLLANDAGNAVVRYCPFAATNWKAVAPNSSQNRPMPTAKASGNNFKG